MAMSHRPTEQHLSLSRRSFLLSGLAATSLVCGLSACANPLEVAQQLQDQIEGPHPFAEMTDDQLIRFASSLLGAKQADIEARCKEVGILSGDGKLTGALRAVELSDGTISAMQCIGICHDERADGTGKAALTFVMHSALGLAPMMSENTTVGGWEKSYLRGWLEKDGVALLGNKLQKAIVPVKKKTNNAGAAFGSDVSSVTETSDRLWCLSAREVCGDIDWFSHEYGAQFASYDAVLNAEGEQYAFFSEQGVTAQADPSSVLGRSYHRNACSWWYRSPFSYEFYENEGNSFFYGVMESGYPHTLLSVEQDFGVVAGFCL